MLTVPALEEQRAQHEFKYDKIRVILAYQTQFDACVQVCEAPKIAELFSPDALADFASQTLDRQVHLIDSMPEKLLERLYADCDLKKLKILPPHKKRDREQSQHMTQCAGSSLIDVSDSQVRWECRKL